MLNASQARLNAARLSRRSVVLVRLYCGPGGSSDYLALGSENKVLEGVHYRGLLAKGALPSTEMGLDIKTHEVQISTTTLKVSNGEYAEGKRFCDFIGDTSLGSGDDWGFENRRCEMRLWTEGITTWADCVQQFDGLTRDIDPDDKVVTLQLESTQELAYRDVGSRLTDADAADTGQGLPEKSRGKIKPIIGGNHRCYQGYDNKVKDTVSTAHNRVPCEYLGVDSDERHWWFVAGHKMNKIEVTEDYLKDIWGWVESAGRFMRFDDTIYNPPGVMIEKNDGDGCIFSIGNTPILIDYWYGKGTVTTSVSGAQSNIFVNSQRMIDKKFNLYSRGYIGAGGGIGDYTKAIIPFPTYDMEEVYQGLPQILAVRVFLYGKLNYLVGAGDGDYSIKVDGYTFTPDIYPDGVSYPDARLRVNHDYSGGKSDVEASVELKLTKNIAPNAKYANFEIYEIYKAAFWMFGSGTFIPLYSGGEGKEYPAAPDDWISGRTQTEPHIDNNQIGLLIENPAGVLEAVLRDGMEQGDGDIDLASFNVASNDLATWKMAPAIIKERGSKGLLAELGRESRSFVWPGPDGKWKMRVLEDTYSAADIVLDCKRAIGAVKFTRTPLKDLVTSVTAHYDYNGERYLSETGTANDTRMQDKWKVTGTQSKWFPKANNLHDQATAEAWRDYRLAQWKQPHICFVGLWGVEAVHGDIADIAELINPPRKPYGLDITQENTVAGQKIYKYWWILNVRRQADRIRIRGFQLHDLS